MATNTTRYAPIPIFDNLKASAGLPTRELQRPSSVLPVEAIQRDYELCWQFLVSYDGSTATFTAYRRELERLCQWSWHIRKASILTLARDDIERFIRFIQKPPIAWIGSKNVARFVQRDGRRTPNPAWRPFVVTVPKSAFREGAKASNQDYTPSQAAIKVTFTTMSSFYYFLTQESFIGTNPVSLIRQRSKFVRKDQNQSVVRRLSNLQWDYVLETAEGLAQEAPDVHERTLFIMTALFALYLRISELVADERSVSIMGDFRQDSDGNWWYHVTGKGNKDRTVTVSNAMLKAFKRYRRSLGLSSLPAPNESGPLVVKQRGWGPITNSRQIRLIVQNCFDAAFQRMRGDGFDSDAEMLREATAHWLRHTGISEDVKTRPREHVLDDAGHATMATTDRYIESDRRERHQSGKRKPVKDL